MHWKITQDEQETRVILNGHLDFDATPAIKDLTERLQQQQPLKDICIDFAHVKDIDSSGLGLLLRLRNAARDKQIAMRLTGCNQTLKNALRTANFQRIFRIDEL